MDHDYFYQLGPAEASSLMPSDLDADLHVLNQLTRGKPTGATGSGECETWGGPKGGSMCWCFEASDLSDTAACAEKSSGFDDNLLFSPKIGEPMTSLMAQPQ